MIDYTNLKNYKNIHFIGIGGVSMSGIAEIMANWGFHVTGSDNSQSEITDKLIHSGIKVTIGSNLEDLEKADIVVYTAAIKEDNIERVKAQELGIPTMERADYLGALTKLFKDTIGISGTHGKTTTTSMVSLCFLQDHKEPYIQVGAILKQLDGNYKIGNSDYFIIEACEYVDSFLKFHPKSAIVLNIDNDHLDYFKNLDNIKKSFANYVQLLPEDGVLVYNCDDENCNVLPSATKAHILTYGIENLSSDFIAKNITFNNHGFANFDVYFKGDFYLNVQLSVVGKHNVLNALSCVAMCHFYNISKDAIKKGLLEFTGAHRRFEYVGTFNNTSIYDDYAHHPTEIQATATALKNKVYNESWAIFQPHTYSRTKNHLHDFALSLSNFDNIIITDIYAAREKNTYGISSKDLVDEIISMGKNALYISDFDEIAKYIKGHVKPNDIVLTVGAGTITNLGKKMLEN